MKEKYRLTCAVKQQNYLKSVPKRVLNLILTVRHKGDWFTSGTRRMSHSQRVTITHKAGMNRKTTDVTGTGRGKRG